MSVLCHAGSLRCTCGQAANGYPPTSAMYGLPTSYNPFGPRAPKPDPPLEVSLPQMQGALAIHASHLSADGLRAYTVRYGRVLQADWDGVRFGSWLDIGEEMPAGAAVLK